MFKDTFPDLPIQTCQFHVMQGVRRIIGTKPATPAERDFLQLSKEITTLSKEEFVSWLIYLRDVKYRPALSSQKGQKAKKACKLITNAMPYLFTCQLYPERNIPNTTNSCEGSFGQWKQKIKLHRGIGQKKQMKMISFLLTNQ